MKVDYTVGGETTAEEREAIYSVLRDYNRFTNPRWWNSLDDPENQERALVVLARNEDGTVLGGLFAETRMRWLKISVMGVFPPHRRQGIGRRLVELAETEAVERACRYAYVETMDFQAPEFYLRLGYEVSGRLEDWDSHGHAKVLMVKTLTDV